PAPRHREKRPPASPGRTCRLPERPPLPVVHRVHSVPHVILANPPFMSPKGGIKPHKRFSIQAKRSEVLFVDYMAEHLTPTGRAAIIVPEGIIFQSQTAYKDLRKMLVDNALVAVVSLPAGCFNPYSGVKTSILLLDKSLARQSNTIAFFKVENDGFGLGAQRRAIEKNDLPQVQAELAAYLNVLRSQSSIESILSLTSTAQIVPKEKIAANGDYNLSGERYREGAISSNIYPLLPLSDFCSLISGQHIDKEDYNVDRKGIAYLTGPADFGPKYPIVSKWTESPKATAIKGDILITVKGSGLGKVNVLDAEEVAISRQLMAIRPSGADPAYVYSLISAKFDHFQSLADGSAIPGITRGQVLDFEIPLPPLEVQKEIVAEIEGYQKVINGARAVLDHYRPHIPIHSDWPMVELREIIDELKSGVSVNSTSKATDKGEFGILKTSCVTTGIFQPEEHKTVVPDELKRVRCPVIRNTIIISRMNTEALVGANAYVDKDYPHLFLPDRLWQTVITRPDIEVRYIQTVLASDSCRSRISAICGGTSGSMKNIAKPQLLSIAIPLPPLSTQQAIVAEIETEQALVNANRELIARMEKKIQATLARVWGEAGPAPATARAMEATAGPVDDPQRVGGKLAGIAAG
ncbi:MAG: restriction endonuclease subunit S, partial [Chromatiaceae bacterium]|nr:restriction endonuclease subunit S [Chromatiaceae bacterium]